MKKFYFLSVATLLIVFGACKDIDYGTPKPECEWTSKESISVDPVKLKAPSGMSGFYNGQFPGDKVIRNLQQALWAGNHSFSNKGKISGDLTGDGSVQANR